MFLPHWSGRVRINMLPSEQLSGTILIMKSVERRNLLAIDYGRRRIGLAKSDELGLIASAYKTIDVNTAKQTLDEIAAILAEVKPNAIVIGYPMLSSGDRSKMCDEIDQFIAQLEKMYPGPIHKVDEFGSSGDAVKVITSHGKKSGKRKAAIDRLAAVIILQRYMDGEASL